MYFHLWNVYYLICSLSFPSAFLFSETQRALPGFNQDLLSGSLSSFFFFQFQSSHKDIFKAQILHFITLFSKWRQHNNIAGFSWFRSSAIYIW